MPDISMCPSPDCPVRGDCYRNEASGTEPSDFRQSWIGWTWRQPGGWGAPVECDGYCSARPHPPASGALKIEEADRDA